MGKVRVNDPTIAYGQKLRIGYKAASSASAFTYLPDFPGPGDMPFEFIISAGTYDVETTIICPNCSGNIYSSPIVSTVAVLT
jgi:hypothetical protein